MESKDDKILLSNAGLEVSASSDGGILLRNTRNDSVLKIPVEFPAVVRSAEADDVIEDKDGSPRSVFKILKNWHVPQEVRTSIPVVEACLPRRSLLALAGSLFGYPDWIVRGKN